jgi:hypothetical protein
MAPRFDVPTPEKSDLGSLKQTSFIMHKSGPHGRGFISVALDHYAFAPTEFKSGILKT